MTKFKEVKIDELFEVKSSKHNYFANQIYNIYEKNIDGTHPYIVRATTNNGLKGFIEGNEDYLNPGQTISFAQDSFIAYYQKEPYYTGNKIKVLVPIFKQANREILLYIVTSINKTIKGFSWGVGSTVESIRNISMFLPFDDDDKLSLSYMEEYIKDIESKYANNIELFLNTIK